MIRDDAKIIVTPTGISLKEALTKEAVKALLGTPNGNIPSDKQKCQSKAQHEYTIKGIKIMAASKKDAIKKYNHHKK